MNNESQDIDEEIYRFGLFIIKHDGKNLVLSLVIGILLGCMRECVVFTIAYMGLRRYMGGYHAPSPLLCVVESVTMLTVASILAHVCDPSLIMVIIVDVVYLMLYYRIPVETKNRPLCKQERRIFKRVSLAVVAIYTGIALLLYEYGWLYNCILYAIICCEGLSAIQIIKNSREKTDKCPSNYEIEGY